MIEHKTESIYRRCSIVDQAMLEMGTSKLEACNRRKGAAVRGGVSMRKRSRSVV
jgi:hypothetical protein